MFAATAFLFSSRFSYAQEPTPVVGDYGSVASGNWSSLSTWKQWDGTGWNTTPTGGPGSSKQVFILTGTSVTYDVSSQNCKNLIVESGATFKTDSTLPCPPSSLMPLKVNGPIVWVDGNLGSGPKDALVLETKYGTGAITLEGNGIVNLAQVRPNSGQSGTLEFVFAMNANINYAGIDSTGGAGIYTQRGSQTSSTITINAGDTVNFAANSNFMINATAGLNGTMNTTLNVNGVLNDSGTVVLADSEAATAALNIGGTGKLIIRGSSLVDSLNGANIATITVDGVYEHAMNGGKLPTAKWNTGSTCLVTGSTTLGPTNANQNFYNLTVDCPSLMLPSYPCHFDMSSNTIAGNLRFVDTDSSYFALTGYEVQGSPKTITVNGNFEIDSTNALVAVDDYGSTHPIETVKLIVHGNVSVKGSLGLTVGSARNLIDLVIHGNLNLQSGAAFYSHSKTQDSLFFAGTGVQTYTAGALSNGNWINTLVQSGSILDMGSSAFQGSSSSFTVEAGGTLKTADTLGLDGNIRAGAGKSLSNAASFEYNGAAPQVTGSLLPDTISSLTINNASGVLLSHSVEATGALAMTNGVLLLDTNSVVAKSVTGGSSASYLSTDSALATLTIPSVGQTQVIFPIGTSSGYAPVWVTSPTTPDGFTVSVKPDTNRTTNGLGRVNVKWDIVKSHYSGSTFDLQFGWMASEEDSVFAHNRSSYATIYLVTDTSVTEQGTGAYATQFTSQPYTVSRSGITAEINSGTSSYGSTFVVGHFTTTAIQEQQGVPAVFKLSQNYPNPFNPTTRIEFSVAKKGQTSLIVYNILGQEVVTLFSADAQPGRMYGVTFNGGEFASGVYFSVLQNNGQRQIQKMVLMK